MSRPCSAAGSRPTPFGGASADPVPHGETGEPAVLHGGDIELGIHAGDGDEMFRVIELGGGERGDGFEHAVAGFRGTAGFRDDDDEGFGELPAQGVEDVVDAVGVGVVEEVHRELVLARRAEGGTDELRAERGAADADDQKVLELALGPGNGAGVNLGGEVLDGGQGGVDCRCELGCGREVRGAQPVMADHPVLVGVGDGAFLERGHVSECLLHPRRHGHEELVRERDAADIERDAEFFDVAEVGFEAGPDHGTAIRGSCPSPRPRRRW